jgi:hypothetical protein
MSTKPKRQRRREQSRTVSLPPTPAAPVPSPSAFEPAAIPPEVNVHLAEGQHHLRALQSAMQQAFWKAEDHGAADVATRIEKLEMALTEVRDELSKLTGGRHG